MSIAEIYKAILEEAGPSGEVILCVDAPKVQEDAIVNMNGSPQGISWLLQVGVPAVEADIRRRLPSVLTVEWKSLDAIKRINLTNTAWDVVPVPRRNVQ